VNRDGNVNFVRPSAEFTSIGDYDETFYMRSTVPASIAAKVPISGSW